MAKKKLIEDIKVPPGPFLPAAPGDVMRDRRFDDSERLEILRAWAGDAEEVVARQIESAIRELENRKPIPSDHAAE